MSDLSKLIKGKVKENKVIFGYNSALKILKTGKAERVIYANNLPQDKVKLLKHNAGLSKTQVEEYPDNGMELGLICGKPFSVGAIAIKGSEK
jgi:large subunit ribosomal protein L30e